MQQMDMFASSEPAAEPPRLARKKDPLTSKEAGDATPVQYLEAKVLACIASFGRAGCISDDVRAAMPGLAYSSVTARFKALVERGDVILSGGRLPGRSGRSQRIMIAKSRYSA